MFAVLGPVVGHEIQYRELGLVRNEVRGENIRVRNVGLLGAVRFGYLEAEAPSLLAVQQGCEDRRRVELGQAEPFDVSCFRYQGGRAAVAYGPVIESMVHGETRFIGFSFATAFLRSGSPSVRAFCGTAPKRPVLFGQGAQEREHSLLLRHVVESLLRDAAYLDGERVARQRLEHIVVRRVVAHGQNEVVAALFQQPPYFGTFAVFGRFDLQYFASLNDLQLVPETDRDQRAGQLLGPQLAQPTDRIRGNAMPARYPLPPAANGGLFQI